MAEREGFEPSVELLPYTRLAGERLQPTRPSLRFLGCCVVTQVQSSMVHGSRLTDENCTVLRY
jgi:hypothetical protein